MARPLPVNPTFLPPTHGVLKSLLENPLKLPFHHDEGTGCCFFSAAVMTENSSVKLSCGSADSLLGLRRLGLPDEAQHFIDEG